MNRTIKTRFGVPIQMKQLVLLLGSQEIFRVPLAAIEEFLTWEKIYKSNYSLSFYDKVKGWDLTQPGTIRISDHWDFESQGKIHCSSVPQIGQNRWAKGIWNEKIEKFEIVEYYSANKTEDKEQFYSRMNEIRGKFKDEHLNSRGMHADIETGRKIATWVDKGEINFKKGEVLSLVYKIKRDYIVIWKGEEKIKVKHGTGDLFHGEEKIIIPGARLRPMLRYLRNEK